MALANNSHTSLAIESCMSFFYTQHIFNIFRYPFGSFRFSSHTEKRKKKKIPNTNWVPF